jgi:hypothetical protein
MSTSSLQPDKESDFEYLTTPQLVQAIKTLNAHSFLLTQQYPSRPTRGERDYEALYSAYFKWVDDNQLVTRQETRVGHIVRVLTSLLQKRKDLSKTDRKHEKAREKKRIDEQGGKEKRVVVVTLMYETVTITCIETDTSGRHSSLLRFPPS